ncbi:hypothetical protein MJO29_001199 [Puccinia striiformis f. sp. tritici]|uniref:Uncharacterized protein n=3 Tax=Puccinia striiformis TaxID=27350 RepID=A0A0L0V5E5_9BASI|nr:hypothetical protein Pst134EA_001173 [Puccinia striiformis f. sp. tritici]KNE94431.1 hypothetical protein PSTG_12225 [Puccinia striiformis f. sp. tritici PST-78]POV99643.1 hypothetical protein PSTT_13647 [Puccinia striiformis]KAH9474131.1 hypothetical protein Pst134EA_001173 [Puccinia striiformis f. sp. tritici]KAI7967922.1 hypothetical protein MJO29_001199 [Puccinia striiformis f. sp. tritici]POW11933.1 hypothetical protein PSHT_08268 [Puccinia striiformis]
MKDAGGSDSRSTGTIGTEELLQLELSSSSNEEEGEGEKEKRLSSQQKVFKRPPPTFEAAFSQTRSLTNPYGRVNYQQALINNNHLSRADSLALLPAPPSSESNNNHLHSLLSPPLQLHDEPATHFLSSLEPTSTELIFSPNNDHHEQQHSLSASPPPPSPTEYLDDPPSSPPGLYGSSPLNHNSPPNDHLDPPSSPEAPQPPKKPTPPPRPAPLRLCLPPRPRRPVIETSQTPCNSPACSNPSTPVLGTSNLRPAIPGPSNVLKRALQPSSSSNQAINTKKQKTNPLLIASSNSKNLSDADKLKIWKHIQSLRIHRQSPGSLSSQTLKELDRLEKLAASNSLGQLTNTLSNAIQLNNQAQEYVDRIQKIRDALGEELVRLQLEESVLRHVRGIIADRLVKNQDWNNQNL